jgi:hypothetical protein
MSLFNLGRFFLLSALIAASYADEAPAPRKGEFDLPLPVGMPVNGIKVPQYDEHGKQVMLLEAATAKKIDETRVEMEHLKLEALDAEGKKIFVELPQAVFNLETRVLTGNQTATIRREDFEIVGDSIEFNTKTRFGKMLGKVRMVISTEEKSE